MGAAFAPFTQRLVEWEAEEGFADEELQAVDWETVAAEVLGGQRSPEIIAKSFATHARFLATKTTEELWAAAFDRNLLITPSALVSDLLTNPHFADRGFWRDVDFDDARTARYCGPLVQFSDDAPERRLAVPQLGADNDAIDTARQPYAATAIAAKRRACVRRQRPAARRAESGRILLGHRHAFGGADPGRLRRHGRQGRDREPAGHHAHGSTPFVDEDPHPDNSVGYGVYNAGKRSLSLDLSKPESRPVVEDLIRWADIATESWAPGAAVRMGYGYDDFSAINPRLIMLSSSLLGQSGPYSSLAGYGFMAAAIAGFYEDHRLARPRPPLVRTAPTPTSWHRE